MARVGAAALVRLLCRVGFVVWAGLARFEVFVQGTICRGCLSGRGKMVGVAYKFGKQRADVCIRF